MPEENNKNLQQSMNSAFDLYDNLLNEKPPVKTCVEAILFISESPVGTHEIAKVLNCDENIILSAIKQLEKEYIEENRGFIVRKIGEGYRLFSNPKLHEILKEFANTNIKAHITQATLETLAIIAYKQPVTRSQIAEIRGVKTDSVVVSLAAKGLIKEAGRLKEPGNPIIYRTTPKFLEILGIGSLGELPPLKSES